MRVKKIFNNNSLLAENSKQLEVILLGRGIAYQKKIGDLVDSEKIEKTFVLDTKELSNKFIELFREVPINHIELCNRIISEAQQELNVKFGNSIYIGLTDHINYALTRFKQGQQMKNILLWDIKRFYKNEFNAALKALKTIKYYEGISLSDDEAGFIALHFVNGQEDNNEMNTIVKETETVKEILNIVKYHYKVEIDEDSLNFSRFVTHAIYLIRRIEKDERLDSNDDFLFNQIKDKYPEAYDCTCKINKYIKLKFNKTITKDEMLYCMVHINRVCERARVIDTGL